MSDDLYQQAITTLAKAATGAGKLEHPDACETVDNPLCGDRVTMDVELTDNRIARLAHDVRGCLLCRAAASAIGSRAPGRTAGEIVQVRAGLQAMLKLCTVDPIDGWPELTAFQPVAAHKSRHDCVLLPFEALIRALDRAAY
ncbi:MAG: iron-sulfur cluster assembly scaffold protein [Alphaproteobacteria bacterium]|nr:iron-sulfur cluster assembly scaffold protein [Alphaproteobacteria bacterium]